MNPQAPAPTRPLVEALSQAAFRAIFDNAPDGMLITDAEGRYVEANPAVCRLLGRTREEVVGATVGDVSAPGMPVKEAWEAFRRDGYMSGSWRVVRPDGATRDLEYTAVAGFLPGLNLSMVRDVTERRYSEGELAKKTELLQKIYDNIPVMISMSNRAGRLEWVNREWERYFGWTLEDVQGRDIIPYIVSGPELERAQAYMRERPDRWVDFRATLYDGRVVDTSWRSIQISDDTFLFFGQDVGERKRVEAERERHVLQLQQLANMALVIGGATSIAGIAEAATHAARGILGGRAAETSLEVVSGTDRAIRSRSVSDAEGETGPIVPLALERLVRDGQKPLRLNREQLAAHPEWRASNGGNGAPSLRGWLAVPLVGRDGRPLGVIQVADKEEGEFGPDDEAMLVQLAQLATVAVENAQLLGEVRDGGRRLRVLSRRLVVLQEEERRTIARELHDEVGQILTGLKLMLETSVRPGAMVDIHQLKDLTEQLLGRVKDLSLNLRPPMLDDLGLVPTLLWHFERYRAQTGIAVRFHHRGVVERMPAGVEITAFRIIQEALTNVARHAGVGEVAVELWAEPGRLNLRIEDDGKGFDVASLRRHSSGLTGMRERALLAGGRLSIESKHGSGTRLIVEMPLGGAPREAHE